MPCLGQQIAPIGKRQNGKNKKGKRLEQRRPIDERAPNGGDRKARPEKQGAPRMDRPPVWTWFARNLPSMGDVLRKAHVPCALTFSVTGAQWSAAWLGVRVDAVVRFIHRVS